MTTTTGAPAGGYDIPMYNRQGVRISLDEWAMLMSEGRSAADPVAGYHRIGYDMVGPFTISTAWSGFDSRAYLGGEPLIFQSSIMSPHQGDQVIQYATEDEARRMHAELVDRARVAVTVAGALRQIINGEDE